MYRCILLFGALSLAGQSAFGADLAIVGGTVHASPDAVPLRNATVVVRDGRIQRVGPHDDKRQAEAKTVIDATGLFVVAGFWNSHVHLIVPGLMRAKSDPPAAIETELRRMFTRWGFTTVFEIAGVPGNALALRDRIARSELRGPLVLTVDLPFYPQDGTPIYVRPIAEKHGWPSGEVATPEQARERARRQLAAGADGVKLFTGAIVGGAIRVLPMNVDVAKAPAEEARARGKPVFAHPTEERGLAVALAAGVDVLAHATPDTGPWTPQIVRRLVDNRIALVPTLKLFESELAKEGAPQSVRTRFARASAQQVKALADAGGTILFGTDVGYIEDADTTRELQLMADAGLDWRAILASLTTAPASRFGYGTRKGRVVEGMDADLVVLGKDPARDPAAFADVRFTIRGGEVIYSAR